MKTKILKNMTVFAGLVILASCGGKDNKNGNVVPTVGPQGHIQAIGSENKFCDINDGRITCSYRDPNTQALCSISRAYDAQNMANFCDQMRSIHNEASQFNGCNVQEVSSRILTENCGSYGGVQPPNTTPGWPTNPGYPGYPGGPNGPGMPGGPFPPVNSGRIISCNVDSNGYRTNLLVPAGLNQRGFAFVTLNERRGGLLGAIGISRKIGEVRLNFQPSQGNLPETLTATIKFRDRANDRDTLAKHSGFAGAPLSIDANINGSQLSVSCNEGMAGNAPVNESATLVCQGNSHMTGSTYQENIQFTRQISTMNSNEEVSVSEAVRISLNKESGRLTVHTNVDSTLGPSMTSSSSLRSNLLVEASETIGKAKITCSVR